MKGIIKPFTTYYNQVTSWFNPIGLFYIKFQILFRILGFSVFFNDIFKGTSLTCETAQVGCRTTCINRYAPISEVQLWSFELFIVMLTLIIFTIFKTINRRRHEKFELKKNSEKYFIKNSDRFYVKSGTVHSVYTTSGYILMLSVRFISELIFLYLEAQLAQHHSQQSSFSEYFDLKEHWNCAINANGDDEAIQKVIPMTNRSIFHRTDENLACIQQMTSVKCWIPLSRMKALSLKFMYVVLIVQTILTFFELLWEMLKPMTGPNRGFAGLPKREKIKEEDRFNSFFESHAHPYGPPLGKGVDIMVGDSEEGSSVRERKVDLKLYPVIDVLPKT